MDFFKYDPRKIIVILSSITLMGCMVGPDFHSSSAPNTKRYTESPLSKKTVSTPSLPKAGKSQQFIENADISGAWWTLFRSPELNQLIVQGLAHSPDLESAKATLRHAKEVYQAQYGSLLLPSADFTADGERAKISGLGFGTDSPATIFNIFNSAINVSYLVDAFGGSRRQVESYRARVDYQRYELIAAYLTLTTNIVTTAIAVAADQEQIKATKNLVSFQQNQLDILNKQFKLGGIPITNVLAQQTLVEQTRALIPPLELNLAKNRSALAVLVGALPSEIHIPKFNLDKMDLPVKIPVSLPSQLVHQRPDILAAEALLHSACADVGVATANLLPQIKLSGTYGWSATAPSDLFSAQNSIWNFGMGLAQPIFHGGALRAQKRAAVALFDQANAQYRQTVLQAFKNVSDALRALETDAQALRAQRTSEVAAHKNVFIIQEQYELGGVDYFQLLIAQQQYQQALIRRVQAQARRYSDTAALFQALGGGWWNTNEKWEG